MLGIRVGAAAFCLLASVSASLATCEGRIVLFEDRFARLQPTWGERAGEGGASPWCCQNAAKIASSAGPPSRNGHFGWAPLPKWHFRVGPSPEMAILVGLPSRNGHLGWAPLPKWPFRLDPPAGMAIAAGLPCRIGLSGVTGGSWWSSKLPKWAEWGHLVKLLVPQVAEM